MTETATIQERVVRRAPRQYTVVYYETEEVQRKIVETKDYHLIPLRGIELESFDGEVFNMEVEGEHNYLANFFLVSNCQNWLTSQAMRDPASDVSVNYIRKISPRGMVEYARRTNASVIVSSYNEPLITSEWAVQIFKEAKKAGLMCAYVSNGNNGAGALGSLWRPGCLSARRRQIVASQNLAHGGAIESHAQVDDLLQLTLARARAEEGG